MELVLYSSLFCPDCRVAKRFLQGHNIPFKEVDVESTPGASDEVIARTGKRAIPQFVIDGEGYNHTARERAFSTRRCPNA